MIDLNDIQQIELLEKTANTAGGKLLMEFVQHGMPKFKDIDTSKDISLVGQEFKAIKGIREHINNKIKFLYPRKGD